MTKEEILDKTHWDFVVEAGMSSIHSETFPLAYKGQAIIAMDVYYNQAIDEAIGVVRGQIDHVQSPQYNITANPFAAKHELYQVLNKLKSLKKQSNGRGN